MRLANALKSDITFQFRQGFYWVYLFLTLVYMVVMSKLPAGNVKMYGVAIGVFSDPSVVGFFFIGGIVMLEKIQGVFKYIGVTPLSPVQYLMSKALSLSLLSVSAALAIVLATYRGKVDFVLLLSGVFLSSLFFTLFGFLVASTARNINQYFIKMIPFLLAIVIPCSSFFIKIDSPFFDVFPTVAGIKLVFGAFSGISPWRALLDMALLLLSIVIMLRIDVKIFEKMIISEEE